MQITSQLIFNASPDRVLAMMKDPKWLADLAKRSHATSQSVLVESDSTEVDLILEAPSQVQKFVGAQLHIIQQTIWRQPVGEQIVGDVSIKIDKLPASLKATATIVETDTGCTVDYSGDLRVDIPLFGNKITEMAAPYMLKVIECQQEMGNEYLKN